MAASIREFFSKAANQAVIQKLRQAGVQMEAEHGAAGAQPLSGKTLVLTGTLEKYTREQAAERLRALGAQVTASVSNKTDFVIAGPGAGSKLNKARTLGVEILGEAEFLKLIGE
jgi:DNA ligase (NAD+)